MPKPRKGERKKKYLGRCMSYGDMQKYKSSQRYAICNSYWKNKKKKLVREYIEEILVPKKEEEIDNLTNKIIDDFVNKIPVSDFEYYFLDEVDSPMNKKIKGANGSYIILTDEDQVIQAIDYFSREMEWSQNPNQIEPIKGRFESFSQLWDFIVNHLSDDYYWPIVDKILNKFRQKFKLEW